jgi:hypothetical protein
MSIIISVDRIRAGFINMAGLKRISEKPIEKEKEEEIVKETEPETQSIRLLMM